MTREQFMALDEYTRRHLFPKPITTPAFLTKAHRDAQAKVRAAKQAAMFGIGDDTPGIFACALGGIQAPEKKRRKPRIQAVRDFSKLVHVPHEFRPLAIAA